MKIEDLNLSSLKYFIDTVEEQSYSAAALKNHVSRPAVSQAIQRLESWSGLKLMIHQKKRFKLTQEGEAFYKRAKSSYEALSKGLMLKNNFDQSLKIGCSGSLIENFFLPTIKKFKQIPKIDIQTGTSTHLRALLEEGRINIALLIDDFFIPDFSRVVIKEGEFALFSNTGKLGDLLVLTEDRPEVMALREYLFQKGLNPQIIRTESWSLAVKLAKSLNAACLVPESISVSPLKKVQLQKFKAHYKLIMAHRRNELLSDAELKFCQLMKGNKSFPR